MTDAVVTRLYRCLVDAVLKVRPDAARRPVTVAEIYQDLVPYRAVREAIGVGLNADYEHAVLRLLAGVGGFARLEPAEAREALRGELDSPDPDVALFRKFAACDVWIRLPKANGASTGSAAAGRDSGASPAKPAGQEPVAPPPTGAPDARSPKAPGRPRRPDGAKSSTARSSGPESPGACAFCRKSLPSGRPVAYCPFCGADQRARPCPSCREPIDPDWRYCIECGATASP